MNAVRAAADGGLDALKLYGMARRAARAPPAPAVSTELAMRKPQHALSSSLVFESLWTAGWSARGGPARCRGHCRHASGAPRRGAEQGFRTPSGSRPLFVVAAEHRVADARSAPRAASAPSLRLTFGCSTFVPKSHTPFQWRVLRRHPPQSTPALASHAARLTRPHPQERGEHRGAEEARSARPVRAKHSRPSARTPVHRHPALLRTPTREPLRSPCDRPRAPQGPAADAGGLPPGELQVVPHPGDALPGGPPPHPAPPGGARVRGFPRELPQGLQGARRQPRNNRPAPASGLPVSLTRVMCVPFIAAPPFLPT